MPVDSLQVNNKAPGQTLANDILNISNSLQSLYAAMQNVTREMIHVSDGGSNVALGTACGMSSTDATSVFTLFTLMQAQLFTTGDEVGAFIMYRIQG